MDRENQTFHPGVYVEKELNRLEITQDEFAKRLRTSRYTVNQLINQHRKITANMALRLERETDVEAIQWLQWQIEFDLEKERTRQKRKIK